MREVAEVALVELNSRKGSLWSGDAAAAVRPRREFARGVCIRARAKCIGRCIIATCVHTRSARTRFPSTRSRKGETRRNASPSDGSLATRARLLRLAGRNEPHLPDNAMQNSMWAVTFVLNCHHCGSGGNRCRTNGPERNTLNGTIRLWNKFDCYLSIKVSLFAPATASGSYLPSSFTWLYI